MELPEYVSEWVLKMRASEKTESTICDYIRKIRNYLEAIHNEITATKTYEFFSSLKTKEVKGEIVRTSDSFKYAYWCCLNNFLGFMAKRGYIQYNYMDEIDKPKNNDLVRINRDRILLTEDDFNKILEAVQVGAGTHRARAKQKKWKERDMCVLVIFMTTGMRRTALSQINVQDIDFDNKTLVIRDKGDKEHEYELNKYQLTAIESWLKARNEILEESNVQTDAFFISNQHKRMCGDTISDLVKKYAKTGIGQEVSPHKLRSGFCSILYNKNPDILFVSRAVGHADIKVTQRYIVTGNKEKKQAADMMGSLLRAY
jgi:integrase/recombinase XerC